MLVAELIVKDAAFVAPNLTVVAPENPLPLISTEVPPPPKPEVGLNPVTKGSAASITMFLLALSDPGPPIAGRARLASVSTLSFIAPPWPTANANVFEYSRPEDISPDCTV